MGYGLGFVISFIDAASIEAAAMLSRWGRLDTVIDGVVVDGLDGAVEDGLDHWV